MHSESNVRSLVKTIVWRIVASFVTLVTLVVMTGRPAESLAATAAAAMVSMVAYYLHERIWNAISWGRDE